MGWCHLVKRVIKISALIIVIILFIIVAIGTCVLWNEEIRVPWHPLDQTIYDIIEIEYPVDSILDAIIAAEDIAFRYRDDILFNGIGMRIEYTDTIPQDVICHFSVPYINKDKPDGNIIVYVDRTKNAIVKTEIIYNDWQEVPIEKISPKNMAEICNDLIIKAESDKNTTTTCEISINVWVKSMYAEIEIQNPDILGDDDGSQVNSTIKSTTYNLEFIDGQYEVNTDSIIRIWEREITQEQ
jgi:hypothetical protein